MLTASLLFHVGSDDEALIILAHWNGQKCVLFIKSGGTVLSVTHGRIGVLLFSKLWLQLARHVLAQH